MHTLGEVALEADAVRTEIEQLYVRGIATTSAADRKKLAAIAEEWERIGAGHVATRLRTALRAADAGTPDAPRALLSAHTSLAVFERLLSLEAAADGWTAHIDALSEGEEGAGEDGEEAGDSAGDTVAPAEAKAAAAPAIEDPKGLLSLVEELSRAIEDLVRTGVPSATESTRAKLDASFKEASRRKLLRLGASLRYVNEEVARFLANDESFSIRRFSLMLHRSWVQARGLEKGLREKNNALVASLVSSASAGGAPRPVASLEVVTLGVFKRTLSNVYTFDFRLRVVASKDPGLVGKSLVYSLVFPRKADANKLPAEANLQLPQPQKFTPKIFCLGKTVKITDAAVMLDDRGGRLVLGPKSTVVEGGVYTDWQPLFQFDPGVALARALTQRPSPLDLAAETLEEVVVAAPQLSAEPLRTAEGRRVFALGGKGNLQVDALIPDNPYDADGEETLKCLRSAIKGSGERLLYGLAYYEYGRTLFLPLSVLSPDGGAPAPAAEAPKKKGASGKAKEEKKAPERPGGGPTLLTISDKKYDISALVGKLF